MYPLPDGNLLNLPALFRQPLGVLYAALLLEHRDERPFGLGRREYGNKGFAEAELGGSKIRARAALRLQFGLSMSADCNVDL